MDNPVKPLEELSVHYTTMFRRIQLLDVQSNGGTVTITGSSGTIRFAVDFTGLKQHNRADPNANSICVIGS